jgi:hypothetical protein
VLTTRNCCRYCCLHHSIATCLMSLLICVSGCRCTAVLAEVSTVAWCALSSVCTAASVSLSCNYANHSFLFSNYGTACMLLHCTSATLSRALALLLLLLTPPFCAAVNNNNEHRQQNKPRLQSDSSSSSAAVPIMCTTVCPSCTVLQH